MTSRGGRGASEETGESVRTDVTSALDHGIDTMGCGVWHCAGETGRVDPPPTRESLFGPSGQTLTVDPQEIALRQAVLEERDQVLRLLQHSLLPPHLPHIDGVDVATRYLPMGGGIGGDFYDMFPLENGVWGVTLGDVCGKGTAAASITALALYTIRAAALAERAPAAALELLNRALTTVASNTESRFCTAIFAHLDAYASFVRLRVAIAGHPPILLLRSDGTSEAHGPTGPLLGVLENVVIEEQVIDLRPGDACVLYTDGATDVRHGRDTFGDTRLADVMSSCRSMSAEAIAAQIENAVVSFQEGDMRDDLALVVLAVPPQGLP